MLISCARFSNLRILAVAAEGRWYDKMAPSVVLDEVVAPRVAISI